MGSLSFVVSLLWRLTQDFANIGDGEVVGGFPGWGLRWVFKPIVDEVEQSARFDSANGGLDLGQYFHKLILLQVA